jgi:hypothetical protein
LDRQVAISVRRNHGRALSRIAPAAHRRDLCYGCSSSSRVYMTSCWHELARSAREAKTSGFRLANGAIAAALFSAGGAMPLRSAPRILRNFRRSSGRWQSGKWNWRCRQPKGVRKMRS